MDTNISFHKARKALDLAEQIIEGSIDTGVLQTNINQKLNDLEVQYAPRLTNAESQLAEIAINVKHPPFNAKTNGVDDDSTAIQAAIDYALSLGGGRVFLPDATYLCKGDNFINVKANVHLYSNGNARIKSETGGKNGHHQLVYLKDGASIEDIKISGSNYVRQSGGADGICYNKIGITTQGAVTGKNTKIKNVGFEKFTNSHVFVFDNHSDVTIEGCYTFGQQIGKYVNVDVNYLITNWNTTKDSAAITAGTQVYCLTNFYNSGVNTNNILILKNILRNITDAFCGINSNAYLHIIKDNVFIKDADGYYGGWGIDVVSGKKVIATGNIIIGATKGCHLYGSRYSTIKDNYFEAMQGVWIDDINNFNDISDNQIVLMSYSGLSVPSFAGVYSEGGQRNKINGNTIDCNSLTSSVGISLVTKGGLHNVGNAVANNNIINATEGIKSADANNDGNNVGQNYFYNVTTQYPRNQLFRGLKNLTSISSQNAGCNNLGGRVTLVANTTSIAVSFSVAEPDASYKIIFANETGSLSGLRATNKTVNGFDLVVDTAPPFDRPINWMIFR